MNRLSIGVISCLGAVAALEACHGEDDLKDQVRQYASTVDDQERLAVRDRMALPGDLYGSVVPVPSDAHLVRHFADGDDETGGFRVIPNEKLVYSNTCDPENPWFFRLGTAWFPIGDDAWTTALGSFPITKLVIRVNGGAVEASGATFDVDIALTDYCPGEEYSGPTIPGTNFRFTNLDAYIGIVHELVINFKDPDLGVCLDTTGCRISEQDCRDGSECVVREGPVLVPPLGSV